MPTVLVSIVFNFPRYPKILVSVMICYLGDYCGYLKLLIFFNSVKNVIKSLLHRAVYKEIPWVLHFLIRIRYCTYSFIQLYVCLIYECVLSLHRILGPDIILLLRLDVLKLLYLVIQLFLQLRQ